MATSDTAGARQPRQPAGARARAGRPRTRRSDGAALTPERIVDQALRLTEREGAQALTMRRLGDELGVDPTAVYRHFRDKDDLVLACLDRVIGEAYEGIAAGGIERSDWRAVLRAVADASWASCQAHPAIYAQGFYRTTGGPGEQRMVELLLSSLATTGLSRAQTVVLYRAFVDSVLGLCGMEAASRSLEPAIAQKDATAWTRIYAVLPEAEYPAAREHAAELSAVTDRDVFDNATQAVISLIESRIDGAG